MNGVLQGRNAAAQGVRRVSYVLLPNRRLRIIPPIKLGSNLGDFRVNEKLFTRSISRLERRLEYTYRSA